LGLKKPKNIKHRPQIPSEFSKISPFGDIFAGVFA